MDNKWIIQQTHKIIIQLQDYRDECRQYPDAEKLLDWEMYSKLQDDLEEVIKTLEDDNN